MIPRFRPFLGRDEFCAFLKQNKNAVKTFEKKFAKKFGHEHGIMFSYGRTAIYSLLKVWQIDSSEVICPAYTCTVVPHAIEISGNTPIFVDSKMENPNMDLDKLEQSITQNTRAIIFTHILGYPANVLKLRKIVKDAEARLEIKIHIIQDVAHSFGCTWKGENVCVFGDAAIFGLNVSKIVTSIVGGMVITSDHRLSRKLYLYRENNFREASIREIIGKICYFLTVSLAFTRLVFPLVNLCERLSLINRFVKYYDDSKIEFPGDWLLKPMNWAAKIGLVQLGKYDNMVDARRQYLNFYKKNNTNKEIIILEDEGATYSQIVGLTERKYQIIKLCLDKGVQLGEILEYVCPLLSCYREKYQFKGEDFPNAKRYSERVVNLPVSGCWNQKNAQKVIDVLNEVSE